MSDAARLGSPAFITRAVPSDAAEILALQKLAFASEAALYDDDSIPPLLQTEDEMRNELERQIVLKALVGRRIVGSVRAFERDGTCHVGRLIVAPELQGRGIGSCLLRAIERSFPSTRRFELFTGLRSERNLHLYGRRGYAVLRTETVRAGLDMVFLVKE